MIFRTVLLVTLLAANNALLSQTAHVYKPEYSFMAVKELYYPQVNVSFSEMTHFHYFLPIPATCRGKLKILSFINVTTLG
jgi:hypothetical protein